MKNSKHITAIVLAVAAFAAIFPAFAQEPQNPDQVFFHGDGECGISSDKTYTHALDFGGVLWVANPEINGVLFHSTGDFEGTIPDTDFTWAGAPRTPIDPNWVQGNGIDSPDEDEVYKLLFDFNYGGDGTFEIGGLEPGLNYEFRLYQRAWEPGYGAGNRRDVRLTFRPDEFTADVIVIDPEMPPARDFYVSYRYTAGGDGILRMDYAAENSNGATLHFYGVSNELGSGADAVEIVGAPRDVSEATPPFGWMAGLAENDWFDASVPAVWTNAADNKIAVALGWEVLAYDAEFGFVATTNGVGASFRYTHSGAQGKIVWSFAVSNLITATAVGSGSVSGDGWCESAQSLKLTATPASGAVVFHYWEGDVPFASRTDNPLFLKGDEPREVRAVFSAPQHVATDGDDDYDGSSFTFTAPSTGPKRTIAAAVAALGSGGGMALVADGEYGIDTQIVLDAPVVIRGVSRDASKVTVFRDAPWDTRIFEIDHAEARIEFMTVAGGISGAGGNIIIGGNGGTVADCVVRDGTVGGWGANGGNISIYGADSLVLRCEILNGNCDGAGGGGGIYMWDGRVEQCLFMGNRDGNGEHGAAVWLRDGGTVANCTIARNHGTYGGVVNVSGTGRVINCVIVDNTAPGADEASGGSVFHYAWQASYFQNCVADIFINGTCLTTDGGFGFADAENGDYHLTLVALALDAGAAEALVSATDLDGNPRVVNGIVDAGCYEYQGRGGALDFAFDADLTHHAAPFVVVFHTAVANAVGSVRYEWDFGDEIPPSIVPTTDPTIAHRYEEPGWHTVTATAFDEATFATMTRTAFIYTAPPVIHVVEGADDPRFPYDTFETALPTIQEAFAEADDGTLIVVSNGVYTVADTLTINKGVTVRGFTGDPDDVAFCGGYRLHQLSLSHPDARVENITLRDGEAYHNMYGGNLFISKAGGTVSNCVITAGNGNNHHGNGGGVYMNGGLVTHCFITDNWVGGGASEKGGGVRMNGGSLEHCLVARNTAPDGAGDHNSAAGVYMTGGSVINCTIAANDSRNHGGFYASGGTVVNTVIAGNSSSLFAGDAAMWGGNPNCFLNCWTDTEERINETCFTDTPDAMLANIAGGDYTPAAGSPLIDAGIEIDNPPELDLAGNPRVMGDPVAIIDVGAFESDPGKFTFTFEADVTEGNASVRVVFTAKVAGVEPGDTMRFTWDFGEGGVEFVVYDQLVVTNTYDHNDYYTVSLTLETQSGLSNTVTRTKYLHFAPEVMYVAAGNDENARIPYDDWHNAAATPQDALEFALNGCEIIVGAGVYSNSTSIKVEKRVHLHSEHNDPASVIFTNPDRVNFSLLVMDDADAWVNGVTLDRGTHEYNGANLYFATQGGTVSNCVIRDGVTHDWNGSGSAFHSDSPNALVTHCVITDNITRSDAGQDKCIIKLIAGRMENCLIANNTYDPLNINRSSVIRIFPGAIIRNCTIAGNESLKTGTVFFEDRPYYDSRPPAELVHCVIADNIAVDSGAVWHGWDGATEYGFVNCTADEYLNDTCRDAPAEVIFKNAAAGNYQLASASPAIDHGPLLSPVEIAALPAYDLLGRPRVANGHIDDGCYESKGRTTVIVIR